MEEHKENEYNLHLFATVYFDPQHLHQFPHLKLVLIIQDIINMQNIVVTKPFIILEANSY